MREAYSLGRTVPRRRGTTPPDQITCCPPAEWRVCAAGSRCWTSSRSFPFSSWTVKGLSGLPQRLSRWREAKAWKPTHVRWKSGLSYQPRPQATEQLRKYGDEKPTGTSACDPEDAAVSSAFQRT